MRSYTDIKEKEKTSPRFRSMRYPKLQIFVRKCGFAQMYRAGSVDNGHVVKLRSQKTYFICTPKTYIHIKTFYTSMEGNTEKLKLARIVLKRSPQTT